ncbi:hypothetical protein [Treponema endosymbiont of Eucomonympha sp.]|uniref:hypothetical protein n=1 Tax=Treponema endosymbiont of Eucomonympha sp. TaxID=1580831 RepID=UPI000750F8A6|nr:hypothetical protein [Treponema endosymbiont of Eucomonympha sp.]
MSAAFRLKPAEAPDFRTAFAGAFFGKAHKFPAGTAACGQTRERTRNTTEAGNSGSLPLKTQAREA